ncbi:MAG: ferritin-like domain-containing protein, partial [Thermoanaerobaculia bacterium]|nr:ferritin-like domain-containing protein [Thermoanaerobaculia bacterium]
ETHQHDIRDILTEALDAEKRGLDLYRALLEQVDGKNVTLEEYARTMVHEEQTHLWEVDKMLRKPGDIASYVQQQKSE